MLHRLSIRILRGAVEVFVVLAIVLWFGQHLIIYHPRPYDALELGRLEHLGGRRITVQTSQGSQVAFYLPARANPAQPPAYLWLVCGGNGSLSLDYLEDALKWDSRFGFVFLDYPSYGLCQGAPTPDHIRESCRAVLTQVWKDLGWSEAQTRRQTGVFGHSLGCAAGLMAADDLHLTQIVLCAPFTTMTDMAYHVMGWPLCLLNRHRFDNVSRLTSLCARGAEVRAFHGTDDEVIPIAMSRSLAGRFPGCFHLTEVLHSHHNEVVMDAQGQIAQATLALSGLTAR